MMNDGDALAFANEVIASLGGEAQSDLQPGKRTDPFACPIANTIRAGLPGIVHVAVDEGEAAVDMDALQERTFNVPAGAKAFIEAFDHGHWPQYEEAADDAAA